MENYNLTAELKKIASGITSTDPNTELGNINGNMGNLDTAMQGVATAINGISIPNPGSNIDGVATAINNKAIPDPSSNITAVANAIVSMAGGKDLDDLIAILTTMNGNIANLGSNHIVNILEAQAIGATGYQVWYGNGHMTPLQNRAEKTSYTDPNNIGATNVQSAIDKLGSFTTGSLTINSAYATGNAFYQKFGRVVTVFLADVRFVSQPPNGSWSTYFVKGLPKVAQLNGNPKIILQPFNSTFVIPVRLAFSVGMTELDFHWTFTSGISTSVDYNATFTYICE